MKKTYSLLTEERLASIREIQKNPSRALSGITRVLRGNQTYGFFFSVDAFDELMEDWAASRSVVLRQRVRAARKGLKKSDRIPLDTIARQYGL